MFLETRKSSTTYTRKSKNGVEHTYTRNKTIVLFRCDNCDGTFERELGRMDHRRLSNKYFHVCPNCNPKQFAQRMGVEKRHIWDLSADRNIDISRI